MVFSVRVAEESVIGGIKIAAIAGRNLKYSDCEQIEGFSDTRLHTMLAVKIV